MKASPFILALALFVKEADHFVPGLEGKFTLGFLSILFPLVVFLLLRLRRKYLGNAVDTYGTITNVERRENGGGVSWHPTLRFELPDGEVVTVTMESGAFPLGLKVGRKVKVRYNPQNYRHVEIAMPYHLFLIGILMRCGFPALRDIFGTRATFPPPIWSKNWFLRSVEIHAPNCCWID